jgi:hypothetical protein
MRSPSLGEFDQKSSRYVEGHSQMSDVTLKAFVGRIFELTYVFQTCCPWDEFGTVVSTKRWEKSFVENWLLGTSTGDYRQ